ncbi:MAG TPA: helix-turn-helix domain-containing protein [Solirubrobacteraceae bacterium]|nr:helix-turn-helix domain-containing protein [Solirubrobacteraceae bacterium]
MDRNLSWPVYAESTESWLDPRAVDAILDELPALADEIIQAIQREVPGYSRPLSGEFGRGIRSGTELALRRFIGAVVTESPAVYRRLGYGEHRAGRSLDALQSAYRIGARVAWRRMSHAAAAAGASAEAQRQLAEAMFAYIDQLAAESVEGYAEAQLAEAGEFERYRAVLFATLLDVPPPDAETISRAAAEARWAVPPRLACVVTGDGAGAAMARRLSGDTLHGHIGEATCIIVPNPSRVEHEARAVARRSRLPIGLGPTVAVADAGTSLQWARLALELAGGEATLIVAECRLADIALRAAPEILAALHERALAPLQDESERSRARLEQTLRSWLRQRGSQRAIAEELSVHPQTVRYRLRRLRELFGGALEDPDARFELEVALRDAVPRPRNMDPEGARPIASWDYTVEGD